MDFIVDNLYDFIKFCFVHYCVALVASLFYFIFSGGKKNTFFYVFVIGFLCTFAFHMVLHQSTSRYMLIPVLFSLVIIAVAVTEMRRRWWRHLWWRWTFVLLIAALVFFSFLKFNREGRSRRGDGLIRAAELIRKDFKKRSADKTLLIGNSDDTGLVFIYAGIPGKFYNYASESESPQRLKSQVELHCSQYPLVYIFNDQRPSEKRPGKISFENVLRFPHSYRTERIDRGDIVTQGRNIGVELFRIESQLGVTADRAKIAEYIGRPVALLKNGDLSKWQECSLSPEAKFGNIFLAEHPKQRLPVGWNVDFNNHRSADFTDWSFAYEPPTGGSPNGVWRIHAPHGGFALQSRQSLPADKDCQLEVAAKLSSGCNLLVFLYVYRKDGSYLTTQPVGVYHCEKSGERLLSFPIRQRSLPADGAVFLVGLIGWQGDFSLKKLDIVLNEDGE